MDIMNEYKTARWKRTREKILRRDMYMCRECRRYGRLTEAAEVHHIRHADTAPELFYTESNLVSLCKKCHNKQHPEKAKNRSNSDRGKY